MTEQIDFAASLSDQGRALKLAAELAAKNPPLPPAYITCSGITPYQLTVLVDHPGEFEAWREALNVAPEDVIPGVLTGKAKLSFDVSVARVSLHVWVTFPLAEVETEEAAA
ncbi:hypothetical protein A4E84_20455 [Streptomyces qaidamensis]|uniref:Uncharacterized protein n=1 Tax=Streptomyces qaidamensis TaxID=1783515 RepID=A0A143C2B7_9ACTN|nr:hypothetical protein [Streptomyces qaidamensis]AMW11656.1 hypothetical protein A4E84_20455 [Streptomyces qaidamensis]